MPIILRPQQEKVADLPGIVLIHEWWGLNDDILRQAQRLADEGFLVAVADLYHGTSTKNRDEARSLALALDKTSAVAELRQLVVALREAGARRIGSIGWCMGGKYSLLLALSGERIDATGLYYGELVTDSKSLQSITWPVFAVFGLKDRIVPISSVQDFKCALDDAGINNEIHVYANAGHAFANSFNTPDQPHSTVDAEDAWSKMVAFFRTNLHV
jgi:carboxymethylenebutenolidase